MEQFEAYFQRADTDRDGRISGNEAVAFFQGANLPKPVLAQIWTYADQNRTGFLGRPEFYNALKLVTVAQSKRDLTPDLVKAALYGPASAQIPAPKINIAATPAPQSNMTPGAPPGQLSRNPPTTQGTLPSGSLGFPSQPNQLARQPRPLPPTSGFQSQVGVSSQGMSGAGSISVSHRPSSSGLLSGSTDGSHTGISSQVLNRSSSPVAIQGGVGPLSSNVTQAKTPENTGLLQSAVSQAGKEDSKAHPAAGNGFAFSTGFGEVLAATPLQPKQNSVTQYSAGSMPASSSMAPTSARDQPTVKHSVVAQPPVVQGQQFNSMGKANQHVPAQSLSANPTALRNVASTQTQSPWPRMTQSDIQKYSKVFVQVDSDRDGKITGEQARNLFLSWGLEREVLKQVWDLSDQDNDSMLSLREFCIALYLMERSRAGCILPTVLPAAAIFEGTMLPGPGRPAGAYSNASWRPTSGFQQPQGARNARSAPSAPVGRPPRPVPISQPDEPIQQKPKVPVLEKNLVDQLSKEEQDALNKKFEEAKDAEKKVADLEKDILEAKQKIQFYHAKMQELILYKSRCDNRLNEIMEKVVADKKEAEVLAKKYEEKYKQAGDVASKLTIEEATFRDIQEKKMELYRAIIKLEHDNTEGVQDRVNQIQSDLEELVKALNDRCKTYGLRGKPTTLVELPFGWQPGIAGTAADWDENWDKFEDEGFKYVKELTLDVENFIAPPKPKTPLIREKDASLDISGTVKSPRADDEKEVPSPGKRLPDPERANGEDLEHTAKSPPDSPARSNAVESPSKELQELRTMRDYNVTGSPRFDTQSEYGGESVLSWDRGFDEPALGSFDTHYDTDAGWDFNPATPKDADRERSNESSLFGGDDWGLNPIRTGSTGNDTSFSKQGPFFDSVPSTPLYNSVTSPHTDNLFMRNSIFADSVPSTPMYNSTSPKTFNEGSEQYSSFDNFSRFDSFNMHDSGPFGSRDSLTRFDSMRSTRDSTDFDQGYYGTEKSFARFDSFRSTADSDYNFGSISQPDPFSRFDSMHSPRDSDYGHGFTSFDDTADPFGSDEPFRTSHEAQTPKRDSDSWKAF